MPRHAPTFAALFLLAAALPAAAQIRDRDRRDSDDEWLARCDRDAGRYARSNRFSDDRYRACDVRVETIETRQRTLRIDPGQNGGASVIGWDRDAIEVHARIQAQASSQRDADDAMRDVSITARGGEIRANTTGERGRSVSVSFVVYVPRRTDLEIETINGPVGVEDVVGRMTLAARNGPISLQAVGGDVRARAQNGPLTVALDGARWEGEGLDAETVNGPVHLSVPRDYNAELETGTENGPAFVGFPMTVNLQGRLNHRIRTTLGRGGSRLRVVTTNGPLHVDRR
jgi:DUF4097 and DUF4098 domain-containing protein YvlB